MWLILPYFKLFPDVLWCFHTQEKQMVCKQEDEAAPNDTASWSIKFAYCPILFLWSLEDRCKLSADISSFSWKLNRWWCYCKLLFCIIFLVSFTRTHCLVFETEHVCTSLGAPVRHRCSLEMAQYYWFYYFLSAFMLSFSDAFPNIVFICFQMK